MFQKIPHKERIRQAKYRSEHEENLEERRIRRYMKELEEAKRNISSGDDCTSDKERQAKEDMQRLMRLMGKLEDGH